MSPPAHPRNAVALLVGIGSYRRAERIGPLRYATRDARSLARLLRDPEVCGFPPNRVVLLADEKATRARIGRRLARWLPEQAAGADLVLIYFAGHGTCERVGGREEFYLLPHDADPDDVITRGVPMTDLVRFLDDVDVPAIIILDCCHAAGILPAPGLSLRAHPRDMQIQPALLQSLGGRRRFLIASCDRGQQSIEADDLEHGLFTYHLLEGLRGAADRDGDGQVGVAELFKYVADAVRRDARDRFQREQTPWTSSTYNEELTLATVRGGPPRVEPAPPRSTVDLEAAQPTTDEEVELIGRLGQLRRRPDLAQVAFVFGNLAHRAEEVRKRARQALSALDWEQVVRAGEDLARKGEVERIGALLEGLAALETHPRVVALLDRLAGLLRGGLFDRAVWLLDRKRLAQERERLAGVFRDTHSIYEIIKVLGPGTYTGAYLARMELTGLEVVVRVLRPEYVHDPLVRSHFLDVGSKAVRLVHQNLVLTREARAFPDRDLYFIVRDFIPGATLREILESGRRFEPLQVCKILRQVLDALAPLHRDGLAHAGIKPSNLFLGRDDRIVLGDPSLPIRALGRDVSRLAYDFRYVPPMLFRAPAGPSPGIDFYALGCVAHELFRGQPPFVADNPDELIVRHERDPIPSLRGSHAETILDDWLRALLDRTNTTRFGDLAAVLAGLDRVEEAYRPRPVAPPSPPCTFESDRVAPTMSGILVDPPSVHLMREQSLMQFEDRQSIVPLTRADGGPPTGAHGYSMEMPAPEPRDRMAPFALPGYEILEVVGRGGMGVVYRARQRNLNRIVALKMILSGSFAGTEELSRFRVEGEVIALLQHPNILQIYDLGEYEGRPYLVLEFCAGGSLSRRLREGNRLEIEECIRLGECLAGAVDTAHRRGIVHRDLKPSNVLFTDDQVPKITDFGLARRLDMESSRLTTTGMVLGTPAYMAPEQASGQTENAGPPVDVYALGAMLYEVLTGAPPFHSSSPLEILRQVMDSAPVPPSTIRTDVPADLESICLKCLEKDPQRRYPSAAALAEDLRRCLLNQPPLLAGGRRARRSRWWPFGRS